MNRNTLFVLVAVLAAPTSAQHAPRILLKPDAFRSLTEPPCSYCSTQNRKGLIRANDRVVAWLRGAHNGGAFPLRIFLSGSRVVNDTYGLFFYDPDGGYVSVFEKDYGYNFLGWQNGVMIVRSSDGTVWSALSGEALDGRKKGARLKRVPSLTTDWGYWLMLHPESTTYDLFDGKKYKAVALPSKISKEAKQTMGAMNSRLAPHTQVLGVEIGDTRKAYVLPDNVTRACFMDTVGDQSVAVFWYGPTRSATAFSGKLGARKLTFYADDISPDTAPFKDWETGTRWSLAGRGIDGPLRGKELTWIPSVHCRWYAWAATYPQTEVFVSSARN